MEVLEHGNNIFKKRCHKCEALLSFCTADIITHNYKDDAFGYYTEWDIIKCPECGMEIVLDERTIEI